MKIVYLSKATLPSRSANSVQIVKMCNAFAEAGHSVDLIATGRREAGLPAGSGKDPWSYYGVAPTCGLYRVPWLGLLPGRYHFHARMSAWKARRLCPDLVYGRDLMAIHSALQRGCRVVFESHSPEFERSPMHRRMASQIVLHPRCRGIVTISRALQQAWLKAFPEAKDKLLNLHDGADSPEQAGPTLPEAVEPAGRIRSPEADDAATAGRPFTVGYLGSLHPGKGMELLEEVIARCPEMAFRIAGGEPEQVRRWAARLNGNGARVQMEGHLPHHQAGQWLAGMDALVAPYAWRVSPRNGGVEIGRWMSPLKLFEYMAAGKPIVASDLPTIGEVLTDGENALLVDPEDPDAWAAALRRLNNEPEMSRLLADRARHTLEENYTWPKRAERLLHWLGEGPDNAEEHS